MQPRIYTYKITFEEVPYYYYGSKKEKYYNQPYMGSPVTNKWCWQLYTPKKQILELFDYTDEGYEECRKVEYRLIKPVLNDPWCLNERCGGIVSLSLNKKIGKLSGKKAYQTKTGIFAISEDERRKNSSKGGKINFKNKTGIFSIDKETHSNNCKKGGKTMGNLHKKNKSGIFKLTKCQLSECGKKGGKLGAKSTNSQKWKCLVTGYISTSGPLTKYQNKRGIDKSKRIKVYD